MERKCEMKDIFTGVFIGLIICEKQNDVGLLRINLWSVPGEPSEVSHPETNLGFKHIRNQLEQQIWTFRRQPVDSFDSAEVFTKDSRSHAMEVKILLVLILDTWTTRKHRIWQVPPIENSWRYAEGENLCTMILYRCACAYLNKWWHICTSP